MVLEQLGLDSVDLCDDLKFGVFTNLGFYRLCWISDFVNIGSQRKIKQKTMLHFGELNLDCDICMIDLIFEELVENCD